MTQRATSAVPATGSPQRQAPPPSRRPRSRLRLTSAGSPGSLQRAGAPTYLLLAFSVVLSALPLYYVLVAASRTNSDLAQVPPPLTPGPSLLTNLGTAFTEGDMAKALLNSLIVAGCITTSTVLFCTMAGFAFAKLQFRFSGPLLAFIVATQMVPPMLGVIPLYVLMIKIGWVDRLPAVIVPTLVSAFGVLLMRQYLAGALHTELIEAATVDGASTFRIFRSVVLPLAVPGMAVLGMITFLQAWNDFFWPIVVLSSDNPTVQVALDNLGGGYVPDQSVIMAGTLAGTLPVLVAFSLLGRHIVSGVMAGAIKG